MVFLTIPKLCGPVPNHMARKTRMHKVIRLVRQGRHYLFRAGPREHT